jgi:hypothetical protein
MGLWRPRRARDGLRDRQRVLGGLRVSCRRVLDGDLPAGLVDRLDELQRVRDAGARETVELRD